MSCLLSIKKLKSQSEGNPIDTPESGAEVIHSYFRQVVIIVELLDFKLWMPTKLDERLFDKLLVLDLPDSKSKNYSKSRRVITSSSA